MEFLVEFQLEVPDGTPQSEIDQRYRAEASASAELARQGRLVRLWRIRVGPGKTKTVGLYRADSQAQIDGLLSALPLAGWMRTTATPLEPHPNDPTQITTDLLAAALRRAEHAHGEHETRIGHPDADWPDWYAEYIVSEQRGQPLPT